MLRPVVLSAALLLTALEACAQTKSPTTPAAPAGAATAAAQVAPTVSVASVATVQQTLAQPGVILLDVRTPEEYAAGHLSNARNVDFRAPDFAARVAQLDPSKTYVLYCASGNRSGKAAVLFQEKGFKRVVNAGAFNTLQQSGLKTE